MLSSAMLRELPWITWPGVQPQHRWTHTHPTHQGAGPHLRMGAIPTRCFLPGFLPAGLHSGERDKGLLARLAGCWSSEGLGLVAGCEACCVTSETMTRLEAPSSCAQEPGVGNALGTWPRWQEKAPKCSHPWLHHLARVLHLWL
jgi:hypothetical protein